MCGIVLSYNNNNVNKVKHINIHGTSKSSNDTIHVII